MKVFYLICVILEDVGLIVRSALYFVTDDVCNPPIAI